MTVDKWFNSQSRLVQVILLLIPFVGWITELLVRLSVALRKHDLVSIIMAIVCFLPLGQIVGWIDIVWTLVFNHMILTK